MYFHIFIKTKKKKNGIYSLHRKCKRYTDNFYLPNVVHFYQKTKTANMFAVQTLLVLI